MRPVLLVIMDGFGIAPAGPGNAVSLADKPYLDRLWAERPHTTLGASGSDVGLPDGQMGNSEVGHLNMGSGRIVKQELTRINDACADGSIEDNAVLRDAVLSAISSGGAVHFMGLLSDGGVHSSIEHAEALVRMAARLGATDIRLHAFTDGRDVDPKSGAAFAERISRLEGEVSAIKADARFGIATVEGRYYAMDRDTRWERVERAWRAVALGEGEMAADGATAAEVLRASYAAGVTDEFVVPTVLDDRGVADGDAVIFFNFRPDRARELTRAFTDPGFDGFERERVPEVSFVCLTEYDPEIDAPVAFPKNFPANTLADYLATSGLTQFHTAETEKYAHVTFFFNGGIEAPKPGEERRLVASPKVATYDLQPEMSEPEVTAGLEEAILSDAADVYIVNYANCDMVGHTGVIDAARRAVEAVDHGLSHVVEAVLSKGGAALVTADHGNADKMIADDGESPHTAHTTARVPLILACGDASLGLAGAEDAAGAPEGLCGVAETGEGRLADIAPTIVDLLGLPKPVEWTGRSLLTRS